MVDGLAPWLMGQTERNSFLMYGAAKELNCIKLSIKTYVEYILAV